MSTDTYPVNSTAKERGIVLFDSWGGGGCSTVMGINYLLHFTGNFRM